MTLEAEPWRRETRERCAPISGLNAIGPAGNALVSRIPNASDCRHRVPFSRRGCDVAQVERRVAVHLSADDDDDDDEAAETRSSASRRDTRSGLRVRER